MPGHHEGDLVMGTVASNSAVATIVERTTGYLTLIHLPDGHTADAVASAVISRMAEYPAWFARTLTWDNGSEMARHARITGQTGIQVYFADPHAPWQRGSNENINGLLREYLPKGTDLSRHTAAQLQAIQDELNDRPRKRFGFYTPREQLAKLLEQERVATTLNTPCGSHMIKKIRRGHAAPGARAPRPLRGAASQPAHGPHGHHPPLSQRRWAGACSPLSPPPEMATPTRHNAPPGGLASGGPC